MPWRYSASKKRLIKYLPAPPLRTATIVEPFAGSAAYGMHYKPESLVLPTELVKKKSRGKPALPTTAKDRGKVLSRKGRNERPWLKVECSRLCSPVSIFNC